MYIKIIKDCIYLILTEKYKIKILNKTAFKDKKVRITYIIKRDPNFEEIKELWKFTKLILALLQKENIKMPT